MSRRMVRGMVWIAAMAIVLTALTSPAPAQTLLGVSGDSTAGTQGASGRGGSQATTIGRRPAVVPAGEPQHQASSHCDVSFDMKLTIKAMFVGTVSAGAGVQATFQCKDAASSGAGTFTLEKTTFAPYGVVKYNDKFGGGKHFHVRHLVNGEKEAVLRQSGESVIAAWKEHYRQFGLDPRQTPNDWSPVTCRSKYSSPPISAVWFGLGESGVVTQGTAGHRTQELSEDENWKTNAWPAFCQAMSVLSSSPFPDGKAAGLDGALPYTGPDISGAVRQVTASVKAAVPKQANRIPSPAIGRLTPRFAQTTSGSTIRLVGILTGVALDGKLTLQSYRREVELDSRTRVIRSDKVSTQLKLEDGLADLTLSLAR